MNREVRKKRISFKLRKLNEGKLRISVYRSNSNIYAQIIDDENGHTITSSSSISKEFIERAKNGEKGYNVSGAKLVGQILGEKLGTTDKKIYFDRGGYVYMGRIAALADGAREHLRF